MFVNSVDEDYTIYSFHLFQHGKSRIPQERVWKDPVMRIEIERLFQSFIIENNIERISLLGYSMGGKLCLILTELFPKIINGLYLISPDGIVVTRAYKFSSGTKVGIWLFKKIIKKPGWFFKLVNLFRSLRLISKSQQRVIKVNLDTFEKRKLVGETWYAFSKLHPKIKLIQNNINAHSIRLVLLYGAYDKVIPLSQGQDFIKGIENGKLITVQQGHALMNNAVARSLKEEIQKQKRIPK